MKTFRVWMLSLLFAPMLQSCNLDRQVFEQVYSAVIGISTVTTQPIFRWTWEGTGEYCLPDRFALRFAGRIVQTGVKPSAISIFLVRLDSEGAELDSFTFPLNVRRSTGRIPAQRFLTDRFDNLGGLCFATGEGFRIDVRPSDNDIAQNAKLRIRATLQKLRPRR